MKRAATSSSRFVMEFSFVLMNSRIGETAVERIWIVESSNVEESIAEKGRKSDGVKR